MPAKNSIARFHGRYSIVSIDLWRRYVKETEQDISYDEFKTIINASIEEMKKWILKEPIGFQIPELGNIAINKFKAYKGFKAYHNTQGKAILNHNLHTGGNVFKIQWFHSSTSFKSRTPYWYFKASRVFNRSLAVVLKGGSSPNYNSFMQDHFVNKVHKTCKY